MFSLNIDAEEGILYKKKQFKWSEVSNYRVQYPSMLTASIVDITTTKMNPERYPPRIVLTLNKGGILQTIKLLPLAKHEEALTILAKNVKFLNAEGNNHNWDIEKKEIIDALSSGDDADREYALDILNRYSGTGNKEATELLNKHKL